MPKTSTRSTLLFVDDAQENLNLFTNLFKRDHRVVTCLDGEEALRVLENEPVAVLVCDQRMPGLSGTEILYRAREISPDTVRILVTAYPDIDVAVEAINQGRVRRYLTKPWEPSELRALIEQSVEHHELARRNRELVDALRERNRSLEIQGVELAKRNTELKRLDNVKTELLTNVSHELRTPLVSIRGYTDLMQSGRMGEVTDRQQRALKVIDASVKRLVGLIEDLLDLSRLERGDASPEPETLDLSVVLEELTDAQQPRAIEADVRLWLHLEKRPLVVDGDRRRLEQVFGNLLDNALKFNHAGGEVSLRARSIDDSAVQVEVRDTGDGIPEPHLARIFDRFHQVDASSTRRHGGAGIGLSIAQQIVRDHGGEITVTSAEDAGSTFTVTLPQSTRERPPLAARIVDHGIHTLVELVLEGPKELELISLHLTSAGLTVRRASTADQGMEVAAEDQPDALVLDLRDGDVPGRGLLASLAAHPRTRDLPMVVIAQEAAVDLGEPDLAPDPAERLFEGPLDPKWITQEVTRRLDKSRGDRDHATPPRAAPDNLARKVLVVDDDRDLLEYTAELLAFEDIGSYTALSAEDALRLSRTAEDIGLILLDIAMPVTDGFALCRAFRAAPETSSIPIYMVSARVGARTVRQSLQAGADGYLVKPFETEEFLNLVRRVLQS